MNKGKRKRGLIKPTINPIIRAEETNPQPLSSKYMHPRKLERKMENKLLGKGRYFASSKGFLLVKEVVGK